MKEADLISVIVPCYNIENHIASTVKTICNQTYKNLEIILVNDGSKDGTGKVLDELEKADNRIRVIHKENGGVTSARLEGVRVANGEWIGFVDGDDAIDPDMYERLLKNALDSNADISHCGYQMVFPSRVDYYYNTGLRAEHDKITALQELLSGSRIEPGLCNKLFHKTLFHSLLHDHLMDLTIKNFEDLLMNYYLFREADKSVYEDFCPYHYILRKNSAATAKTNRNQVMDPGKVFQIIENREQNHQSLQPIIRSRKIWADIRAVLVPVDEENQEWLIPYQTQLKRKFRTAFWENLTDKTQSIKTRLCCSVVAVSPKLYFAIHRILTKNSRAKYEVK